MVYQVAPYVWMPKQLVLQAPPWVVPPDLRQESDALAAAVRMSAEERENA